MTTRSFNKNSLAIVLGMIIAVFPSIGYGQTPANDPATPAATPRQPQSAPPAASTRKNEKENLSGSQCYQPTDPQNYLVSSDTAAGGAIIYDAKFLQVGLPFEVGLAEDYTEGRTYFGYIYREDHNRFFLQKKTVISARKAVETDALVKKNRLNQNQVLITLRIPDSDSSQKWDAGFWSLADLYIYTCKADRNEPERVSRISGRLSPSRYSTLISVLTVIISYLFAGLALRSTATPNLSLFSCFNPVKLSAGPDGRGSLSKLQILFFSLTVYGLIVYFVLRTGELLDMSATVLQLLGIAGVGATMAKGADSQRNMLSGENRGWLMRKGSAYHT